MNGHVFQTHAEQAKRGQFNATLDSLRVYSSTFFKTEIRYLGPLFRDLKTPSVPKPKNPKPPTLIDKDSNTINGDIPEEDMDIYKEELKQYVKEKRSLSSTMQSLFNIIWGQCSQLMQHKLRAVSSFDTIEDQADTVSLLKEIRSITMQFESHMSIYDGIFEAKRRFFLYKQRPDESNETHLRTYKTLVDSVEHFGGSIMFDPGLLKYEQSKDKANTSDDKLKILVKNKMKAVGLLKLSDNKRYARLIQDLEDHHTFGNDLYPATINSAFEMLQNHSSGRKNGRPQNPNPNPSPSPSPSTGTPPAQVGFSYHQISELVAGDNG